MQFRKLGARWVTSRLRSSTMIRHGHRLLGLTRLGRITLVGFVAAPLWLLGAVLGPEAAAAPGDLYFASISAQGENSDGHAAAPSVSSDGQRVAFESVATNLHAGDRDPRFDVYLKDIRTGAVRLISTSGSAKGNGNSRRPSLSAAGAAVAFHSTAFNFDARDRDPRLDVYVKDLGTGRLVLASTSDLGVKANGESFAPVLSADGATVVFTASGGQGNGGAGEPSISADGRFVAFGSWATNLVPDDTNGLDDVFVHDRRTGTTRRVSVATGGGQSAGNSFFPALSADGRSVAFTSHATNLVPGDTNGWSDVFVHTR
jgi:Tol biopolymer transport system component